MVGITRKYTAYLLRCYIIKSVHPCTLLMASFGKAETSLLFNTSGIHANVEAALPLQLASFAEWQNVATEMLNVTEPPRTAVVYAEARFA